jgi:hypothetical protein
VRQLHHLLLTAKEVVMPRLKVLGFTFIALLCVAFLSAAPASAEETAPQALPAIGAAAIPVTCGLGLPDPAPAAKGEVCAAESESKVPEFLANSKKRLGYCHCGCVNQRVCRTSADCGGASCDQFISCC